MIVKYVEHENPFVVGGKEFFKIVRETKTRYVVKYSSGSLGYFKKLPPEYEVDGESLSIIPHEQWCHGYTLRIREVKDDVKEK